MDDSKMISTDPVKVAIIGTGTGDGGPVKKETVTVTPKGMPNLIVTTITPILAIAIRFVNAYLTILVGLVAAGMSSEVIPYTDFVDLVGKCAGLSIAGAGLGLLKDLVTIFGRLEGKYPLLTGNV